MPDLLRPSKQGHPSKPAKSTAPEYVRGSVGDNSERDLLSVSQTCTALRGLALCELYTRSEFTTPVSQLEDSLAEPTIRDYRSRYRWQDPRKVNIETDDFVLDPEIFAEAQKEVDTLPNAFRAVLKRNPYFDVRVEPFRAVFALRLENFEDRQAMFCEDFEELLRQRNIALHRLEFFYCFGIDLRTLRGVNSLILEECDFFGSFRPLADRLTSLAILADFSENKIQGLEHLKNCRSLELVGVRGSYVNKLKTLPKLEKLVLRYLSESDVSALAHLYDLSLSGMECVSDVSALSNVHTLHLESLSDRLRDVSMLGSVHTLTLRDLRGVSDVSALHSVYRLTLVALPTVKPASLRALRGVCELRLREMPALSDLQLFDGSRLCGFSPTGQRDTVRRLMRSRKFDALNLLPAASSSSSSSSSSAPSSASSTLNMPSLLPLLQALDQVELSAATLTDASLAQLNGARFRRLVLYSLPLVTRLPALHDVQRLELFEMPFLRQLDGARGVPTLVLRSLRTLKDVSPLRTALSVELWDCAQLSDLRPLRSLRRLVLSDLPAFKSSSALAQLTSSVPELVVFNLGGKLRSECGFHYSPPKDELDEQDAQFLASLGHDLDGLHPYDDDEYQNAYVDSDGELVECLGSDHDDYGWGDSDEDDDDHYD